MPIPQEDLEWLKKQGVNPDDIVELPPDKMSGGRAALSTLKAHAGGIAGGGAATLIGAALAPETGGLSLAIPVIAGLAGSYGGQKLQDTILPQDVTQNLQQEAAQASEEHPYISKGTDIIAGALASGGAFSPRTLVRASKGLLGKTALSEADELAMQQIGKEALSPEGAATLAENTANSQALKSVALQSAINPAIDTGVSLATTGHLPSGLDIAGDVAGGALFGRQSKWASRVTGHTHLSTEPNPEPSYNPRGQEDIPEASDVQYDTKQLPPTRQPIGLLNRPQFNMPERTPIDVESTVTPVKEQSLREGDLTVTPEILQKVIDKGATKPVSVQRIFPELKLTEVEAQDILEKAQALDKSRGAPENVVPQATTEDILGKKNPSGLTSAEEDELKKMSFAQQKSGKESFEYNPEDLKKYNNTKEQMKSALDKGDTESFQKLWKDFEDVRNKYNGMPPKQGTANTGTLSEKPINTPVETIQHIRSGTATTGSVLQSLATNPNHPFSSLAKHLVSISDKKSLGTQWQHSLGDRSSYNYINPSDDSVHISTGDLQDSRVLMEEAVHSLTSTKIPEELSNLRGKDLHDAMREYLKTGNNEPVKDLIKAYTSAAKGLGIHDYLFGEEGVAGSPDTSETFAPEGKQSVYYAMGDLHEFIAHAFKNEQFQNLLNEMPSDIEGKSVWQRIVDGVKKLLGLDVKQGNMLEHVLNKSSDLIAQERPKEFSEEGRESFASKKKSNTEEESIPKAKTLGLTRAGLDTIREINHPSAGKVADALQKVFIDKESYIGKQLNPVMDAVHNLSARDENQLNLIMRYELEHGAKAPDTMFENSNQRKAYEAARKALDENFNERLKNEEPVYRDGKPTMPQKDPFYWPTTTNPKVANILRANSDAEAVAGLKKTFIDYQINKMGVGAEGAERNWNDFHRAMQGSSASSISAGNTFFNAARKAQGIALPPEFTRPGFGKNLEAYFQAQAADNAYYKNVEKNHEVLAALGEEKDPWLNPVKPSENGAIAGNQAVKNVINELKGEASGGQQGQVTKKAESLATAAILGPLTEAHKLVSNWAKTLTYADNPYQASRMVAHAIQSWGEGWTHAKENGKVQMTAKSAADMFNSNLTAADRLAGVARAVRQVYTLNDLTEKLNMGLLQSMNEALVPYKIKAANEGDVAAMRLMRHLDPDWVKGKTYDDSGVSKLASQLAGVIHGTRDARTLPSWMLHDNEISSFFKLSSWGIAQTNSFMRDVYTPATEGNFAPLINATLGAAVGGYVLKELREKLAGKKSQIPSLQEIASSSRGLAGNIPAVAYNAMAAASYAGFGGMLSTVARYPFDWAFKNIPQGATFPLDTVVGDLASTVSKAAEAIANDPQLNWLELAAHVGGHVLNSDLQLARVALNQAINTGAITGTVAEKKLLSDKMGQLRRFQMVEGLPYESQDAASGNPYMNLEQKKFKMEQDIPTAIHQVPDMIKNIIAKYGNNPDVMLSKLKALKQNSYATMPSMEDTPLQFTKYLAYLKNLGGDEAAQSALQDYMMHKIKNSVKSSVVP